MAPQNPIFFFAHMLPPRRRLVFIIHLVRDHIFSGVNHSFRPPLYRHSRTTHAASNGTHLPAPRDAACRATRNSKTLQRGLRGRRRRQQLGIQTGNMDPFGFILVRCRDDFDNLITREFEVRDLHGGTVHEIGVENSQDGLVRNDEEVVLLSLEL